MRDHIYELNSLRDCRGTLCVVEHGDGALPFVPKRTFWITGVPEGQERGYHAHRTCSELLFALHGSVSIDLTTAEGETQTFLLNEPHKGLLIPPMCWCRLYNFSADAALLCLASEPYDETGYIHDPDVFHGKKLK